MDGLLTHKNRKIPTPTKFPQNYERKRRVFSKVVLGFRNFRYDFKGVGEMFEGDSADMCAEKIPLVSMVAERRVSLAQTLGARTPIGASGNFVNSS